MSGRTTTTKRAPSGHQQHGSQSEQTEIGLFWTEHTGQQYARAFGYFAENYKLNVMDTARLMATLWTGFADSLIACFDASMNAGRESDSREVPAKSLNNDGRSSAEGSEGRATGQGEHRACSDISSIPGYTRIIRHSCRHRRSCREGGDPVRYGLR
jgi:hypothetical protein